MAKFFFVLTILGGILGGLLVIMAFFLPGAPQQAATSAMGIGFAVVPYCIGRAFQEMSR